MIELFIEDRLQDRTTFWVEGQPREEDFFDDACPDASPTLP
jgi:hypothetical protein